MLIRNETRGTILADRAWRADQWFARLKGLLGREGLAEGEGIHIVPCTSIHTWFMKFPIDVAFLGSDGTIIRAFADMGAWRMTRLFPQAKGVIELPAGTFEATGTWEGDQILFEEAESPASG